MIRARRLADVRVPPVVRDPEILSAYFEDASGFPAGGAAGLVRVASEAEAASLLRASRAEGTKILPQAARTSLTGGAVPQGELIVSVELLQEQGALHREGSHARQTVGAGLRLEALQRDLAAQGLYYPPAPTYRQAMIGGTVATNAGGAATFKYGVTRDWVHALRVLLSNGDLLEIERGQATAPCGGAFQILLADGQVLDVPAPSYRLPPLKKISAGYHAADPLDLVDLFVGSEGTLGLITAVTLDLAPAPAGVIAGVVFIEEPRRALDLTASLRRASLETRQRQDPLGPDLRSIEWLDERCLSILAREGDAKRLRIDLPQRARAALLFEMELGRPLARECAEELLLASFEVRPAPDGPLPRLLAILGEYDALEQLELALPGDEARSSALSALREAVPIRVNEMLASLRRADPAVRKAGGDLIVPFERLPEMIGAYESGYARRDLDFVIWGHVSDGNLHPNALPADGRESQLGFEALLEFADVAKRLGGCPLSEHGVGRNPIKQEMLRRFLGEEAIAEMRRIKRALDPEQRFAPGVLFPVA